jgi:hypothetical protein
MLAQNGTLIENVQWWLWVLGSRTRSCEPSVRAERTVWIRFSKTAANGEGSAVLLARLVDWRWKNNMVARCWYIDSTSTMKIWTSSRVR